MRTVFFGRVAGGTGAFQASPQGPASNPFNPVANPCTPARGGAGSYTLTFGQAYPLGQYKYTFGIEGGAANANINFSVAGAVVTVSTAVAAVATDENWTLSIEEIGDQSAS